MAVTALLAIGMPNAHAATVIGQTQTGGVNTCLGDDELITVTVASGPTYVVPGPGVITAWRTNGHTDDGDTTLALRVYDRNSATSFTPIFESAIETLVEGSVNEFSTSFAVDGGEFIGIRIPSDGGASTCVASEAGSDLFFNTAAPGPVGSPETFASVGALRVDIEAILEPDCDGDALGDETQDSDISSCTPPPDTDPPDTTISKGPKKKTTKKQATFEFSADEPGATFECSLDGAGFAPCISPRILKVRKGKHVFSVRATDAAANKEPVPATYSWKVKKKKKKRR